MLTPPTHTPRKIKKSLGLLIAYFITSLAEQIGNILGNTLRTFKESLENLLGTHWEQKKTTTFFSFYFTLIACVFIGSLTLQSIDQLVNSSLNPVKTSIHKPPKGTPYGPKG
jgi:hypothetical protein